MKANIAKSDIPEDELMSRIADGNQEAFAEISQRYMKLLYSAAYRMVSQRADAEDIVQEALLRLWSKAHLWNAKSGASVGTWLYRITYNLCVDQKRKHKGEIGSLDESHVDSNASTDKQVIGSQTGEIVAVAVQKLPERQRAALVLCHYQGLSNADAANIMGTSVKAIEGLLVRARQALKQDLQAYEGVL